MLEIKGLTYQPQTGNHKILDNINLKIEENEIILIKGESGSGKTTLLELICGLNNSQQGLIKWNDNILSARQRRWLCGMVFQFPERYFIGSTIGEELKFGHKSVKDKSIQNVLKRVGLFGINLTLPPEKLSGGEQRRLAVAVQLLRIPDLLLLDEPTAGLDWSMKNEVKNLINNLRNKNTILVVTHEPELFEKLSSKIYSLEKGKINLVNDNKY